MRGVGELMMKKIIIAFSLVLVLALSVSLVACGGNTMTEENTTGKPTSTATETTTEKATNSIIGGAESELEDMSEDATHGVENGTPGGQSSRGGNRTLFPRGK